MKPSLSLSRSLIRTVLNPFNYTPLETLKSLPFQPKSLLYFPNTRTSGIALDHIQSLISHRKDLQIVYAALDSTHQDSIGEVWFDEPMEINSGKFAVTKDKESRTDNSISLNFTQHQIQIPLVRTTGFTDYDYTLFSNINDAGEFQNFTELDLTLPVKTRFASFHSNQKHISDWFRITNHLDNVVTKLDDQPASQVLMDALKHHNLQNVAQKLYVEITAPRLEYNVYEIVAGGGEYGERSEMLVFGCPSLPQYNDIQVRFCVSTSGGEENELVKDGITVTQIQDLKRVVDQGEDVIKKNYLKVGSESGFVADGLNFIASNASAYIKFR